MELISSATELLNDLANSCGEDEAAAWWILMSAAAYLSNGEQDSRWEARGSTVAAWLAGTVQR
jgi:hypothetical protein